MAEHVLLMPDLDGADQAEIVTWHVSAGDHVVAGQPLVAVATSSTVIDIPAPRSGHVGTLVKKPGEPVHPGDPLLEFAESGQDRGAVVGDLPDEESTP